MTGPARRGAVETWEGRGAPPARMVLRPRTAIERVFGVPACTTGRPAGRPAWVRTPDRVKRRVGVKVALYGLRGDPRRPAAESGVTPAAPA